MKSRKRKIAVITGTRADYGLLYWCIRHISEHHELELQLVVTGMHLEEKFGNTYQVIEKDGFEIKAKVPMRLTDSSEKGVVLSMADALGGFAHAYEALEPDLILLLGDRFEILMAAQSAMVMKIPIAHIHGGELTEGLIDEAIRHSLTKMSQIHFASCEEYKNRILQLGEESWRVHNFGAPGLDFINNIDFMDKEELEASLGLKLYDDIFLVTYHPVTLDREESLKGIKELIGAMRDLGPSCSVILTMPNADPGMQEVLTCLESATRDMDNWHLFDSLGQIRYLSMMKLARAVIGNSSSGIIEAPFLGTPTVNIGNRQRGRLMAPSVIQANCTSADILNAVRDALKPEMKGKISSSKYIFGDGTASKKIVECLAQIEIKNLLIKTFQNLL